MVCQCVKCDDHSMVDVAVVGAGPAGLSAALYAGRAGLNTVLFGDPYSGQLARAGVVENFISWSDSPSGLTLVEKMLDHVNQNGVQMSEKFIKQIVREEGGKFSLVDDQGHTTCASSVILVAGTKYKELGVKGEKEFYAKGVGYCTICDGPLYKDEKVVIAGFGNEAAQAALRMSEIATEVNFVGTKGKLGVEPEFLTQLEQAGNVLIFENSKPVEIKGNGDGVTEFTFTHGGTEISKDVKAVFIEVGVLPSSAIASDLGVELDGQFIKVHRDQSTNIPGFFAAGDITGGIARQAIVSAGDGARASISAIDYIKKHGLSTRKLKTTQWGGSKKEKSQGFQVDKQSTPNDNSMIDYIQKDEGFLGGFNRYNEQSAIIQQVKEKLPKAKMVTISAFWCPDCRRNVPKMAKISQSLDDWEFVMEDRDKEGVREKYNVRKIPTFIIFDENDEEVARIIENPKYGNLELDLLKIAHNEY